MDTTQIYTIVNEVAQQAFGEATLTVCDTSTLISLGNVVLSSTANTEAFLNTLAQRIGETIFRFREYRNKLGDMVLTDFEYGAILQKIKVNMPDAEEDESYDLTDGQSVDQWKINKPEVNQKLFVTRTPYQFHVTISRVLLKEAFLDESGTTKLVTTVYGEVRNSIEVSLENLGRLTLSTGIAEVAGTSREIPLVSMYNDEYSPATALTSDTALNNDEFVRFAMSTINNTLDDIQDMGSVYNDGETETFTPLEELKVKFISKFKRRAETVTQYAAFNQKLVDVDTAYKTINYWQNRKDQMSVKIKRPSDGAETTVNNVIGMMYDKYALGIFKKEEDVLTTPVNAAGRYYNTYWHEMESRCIDLSENIVIFTLN